MKILHIVDHSLPIHDGYAIRSINIFRAQRDMGLRPVVLSSSKHEEYWHGPWKDNEIIEGFRFYRTGGLPNKGYPIHAESRLMLALHRRILQITEAEKPDLIHCHSPVLNALPSLWVRRKLGIPVVYEIRAFWEDAGVDQGTYTEGSLKYNLVRAVETWVCKKVDHVITLCNGIKSDLIERGVPSWKLTPVFNGINQTDFKPCPADAHYRKLWKLDGKKVIGFIGSFYRYEGLDVLIQAYARVASAHSDVVLLLVGAGEMESELKAQVRQLNLADKVIMPGQIPHQRIAGVYALIDILSYPRHAIRLTDLVTPLKPLEAMAMGKALVASDVGGHRELIQDNETGLFFPAGDSRSLATKLERLLNDKNLRQRLASNGVAWVKKRHTWEKTAFVYPQIYNKAMAA